MAVLQNFKQIKLHKLFIALAMFLSKVISNNFIVVFTYNEIIIKWCQKLPNIDFLLIISSGYKFNIRSY